MVKKYNSDNFDYIVAYICNNENRPSPFGLVGHILRVNQVKDKKVQCTKSVIRDQLYFNIASSAMNKAVFQETYTKIVVECKPTQYVSSEKQSNYNKITYYPVSPTEIELFELDTIIEEISTPQYLDEFMQ